MVHHLTLANNIPFAMLADIFSKLSKWLIVEFVPQSDKKVKKMLFLREGFFSNYNEVFFEKEFSKKFLIIKKTNIGKSNGRKLYLMKKK